MRSVRPPAEGQRCNSSTKPPNHDRTNGSVENPSNLRHPKPQSGRVLLLPSSPTEAPQVRVTIWHYNIDLHRFLFIIYLCLICLFFYLCFYLPTFYLFMFYLHIYSFYLFIFYLFIHVLCMYVCICIYQ